MISNQLLRRLLFVLPGPLLLMAGCATPGDGLLVQLKKLRPASAATKDLKNPAKVHLYHAQWQEQQRNYDDARESYQVVLEEDSKSIDAIIGLARIDQLAGRTRAAEQGFRKALKIEPNSPLVLDAAGQFYVREKRWPEARDLLNRAMRSAPEDKNIRYHFGVALLKSGDVAGAQPHLAATVGKAAAHYNIGLALHEKGQFEEAGRQMAQAVTLEPELSNAQAWLEQIRREQQAEKISNNDSAVASGSSTGSIVQAGGWSAYRPPRRSSTTRR